MNKREAVLSILDDSQPQTYIPAGFFIHFDPQYHRGPAAVEKHLDYFQYTTMDFVKIQYEHKFPQIPDLQRPEDWTKIPLYKEDFFAAPLQVVEGLVKAVKAEALILVTLYSPFMCAGHSASKDMITQHLKEDPEKVKPGLEAITESLMNFVQGCIKLGVDGFYTSTQGGEADRFEDKTIFERYIKPYDLTLMEEINRVCPFNILHVCDYHSGYDDLTPFLDYPGHVVNSSLQIGERTVDGAEISRLFGGRPFMGGLDRHGIITSGDKTAIEERVRAVLQAAPERFILGADCTLPADINWDDLRLAISIAHGQA